MKARNKSITELWDCNPHFSNSPLSGVTHSLLHSHYCPVASHFSAEVRAGSLLALDECQGDEGICNSRQVHL